jgi:hypothetical protein
VKTIYKFPLEVTDQQAVLMPAAAQILAVQVQNGEPFVWAIVDTENPQEERFFDIFGTGHPMHEDNGVGREYVGTFQMHSGSLVFHLFERL